MKETTSRRILNPWRGKKDSPAYFELYGRDEPVFEIGDYAIFYLGHANYLYTYKDCAFNQLAGLNKEHLTNVANRTEPAVKDAGYWLYQRALETLQKIKS